MAEQKTRRTRLAPAERKRMILDHAAAVVAAEGVAALSMERLGREAGVSKSLVYAYYSSLTELLQALLQREYRHLRRRQAEAAASAETVEQLVRSITHAYLGYIEERGLILDRLAAEPAVADHGDPTEYSRDTAVQYVAEMISDTMNIDMDIALPAVDISFGMPAAAGHYLTRHEVSRQTLEDITVTMLLGAVESLQTRYNSSLKPLKRPRRGRV